ncbi:hypothetical protein CGZ93_14275 [Enemella dayhoffiae]|uniref:DUF4282 domain-containing protein n=2 Tax=Enemella dayhoffiae TaxID=2016507 RepID=A0A255GY96_9ACTN|nr:hypothetical protein CGZ93_14275 [Enemella dayhoffiae]
MRDMSYDQYGQSGYQNNSQNQGWGSGDAGQSAWSGDAQPTQQYPTSQPSAGYADQQASSGYADQQASGYPGSQSSASYPGSQASAAYPGSQASAAYASEQQQGGWAPQQQSADAAWSGANTNVAQPTGTAQNKGLFATLFDFSFSEYATPALAKILYILGIVIGVLYWLGSAGYVFLVGQVMASAMGGMLGGSSSGASGVFVFLGLMALVLGLVPLAFWIISLRMGLEFMLATVKTQQDTAALRANKD